MARNLTIAIYRNGPRGAAPGDRSPASDDNKERLKSLYGILAGILIEWHRAAFMSAARPAAPRCHNRNVGGADKPTKGPPGLSYHRATGAGLKPTEQSRKDGVPPPALSGRSGEWILTASRPGDSNIETSDDADDQQSDMANVMGFTNFGGVKKAKQFDFMAMFEQTRKTAIERNQKIIEEREEELAYRMKSAAVDDDSLDTDSQTSPHRGRLSHSRELIGPAAPESAGCDSSSDEDEGIGPPVPEKISNTEKWAGDEEDEDDDEDEEDNPIKKIPSSHEIALNHSNKAVSALGLDPSGARLVTGGYDYDVKLWDFAGMDSHQIKALEYSTTGDMILVISGNSQAKLIDRDGFEVMECLKGDQYIVDQASTKGHTAMLNNGCWNPKMREEFMTCSNDCTLRLWIVNHEKKHKSLIKTKSIGGRKTVPTACAYSRDGNYLAAGCQDGSIQMWDHRKSFVNVSLKNMTAHIKGTDITCLCFSYDGNMLASRGNDETVKVWDIRNLKNPLCVAEGLENHFPGTDCLFSPDNQLVVTGTSVRKGHGNGKVVFMDKNTLNTVSEIEAIQGASVVRCLWHPKLNQIVTSGGDGIVKVFYDPEKSNRGAKLCVVKSERKARQVQMMIAQNIITPYALPMFRQTKPSSTRRQEEKARKDPVKSHRPELPMSGPGHGGRLGNKGATLSQYVAQNLVLRKPDERDKDPRAAILRHAKEAAENPYWIDPAYKKTQPKPIFEKTKDEEPSDDIEPAWKKQKI
ncbi:hypothetical protein LSH36_251g04039 [Paralvinella palmiformis]|uniref:WD repeat-containing protein 70 n=1 Tax=Paralvinella palmiformis TaxID=53620 RepID=A0AAD9JL73_9ANNE|nr:hypothetical protein LSH36_251g04039 [Paralvinella palmiformis]